MRKSLAVVLALGLTGASAWAQQENVFIANSTANTVTVADSATFAPLPVIASGGPNPIAVGTNPTACLYDSARNLVYIVNSGSGTISVIDAFRFTVTTITLPDA